MEQQMRLGQILFLARLDSRHGQAKSFFLARWEWDESSALKIVLKTSLLGQNVERKSYYATSHFKVLNKGFTDKFASLISGWCV